MRDYDDDEGFVDEVVTEGSIGVFDDEVYEEDDVEMYVEDAELDEEYDEGQMLVEVLEEELDEDYDVEVETDDE